MMTKPAEESPLSGIDQCRRIPADLAVEGGLQEGVFRAEDVVAVIA
jgi:hypothetical protein